MPQAQPELKKVRLNYSLLRTPPRTNLPLRQYLDKRLFVQLNGSRKVLGVLRGYDVRPSPPFRPFVLYALGPQMQLVTEHISAPDTAATTNTR